MNRARSFGIAVCAASLAVALGVLTLVAVDAPESYLRVNIVALAASLLFGALLLVNRKLLTRGLGIIALTGGAAILATAFLGEPLEGVRRWVRAGPLLLHVGMVVMPFILARAVSRTDGLSVFAVTLALLGAALQPDAAIATALAGGAVILAAVRSSRVAWGVAGLAVMACVWCWAQPDPLPAVKYVEGVLPLAFRQTTAAGVLASVALAMPILALVGYGTFVAPRRVLAFVLAAAWTGLSAAALFGKYPTPLVGYGFSPILSYVLCWTVLVAAPAMDQPKSARRIFNDGSNGSVSSPSTSTTTRSI